ncbi:hypothetical protein ACWGKF_38190, partial [Streptomyces chartreusis]
MRPLPTGRPCSISEPSSPGACHHSWWRAASAGSGTSAGRAGAAVAVKAGSVPRAAVLVQDYHLTLEPGMLRELRPDLRIGHL